MANTSWKGPLALRAEARIKATYPMVQSLRKDGKWGKASLTPRGYNETDEQVIERLNTLNPQTKFRIAE